MAPSNGLDTNDISTVFSEVKKELGVELKAGVGGASTAEIAARLASEGPDRLQVSIIFFSSSVIPYN
jgi:GTP cyclohydrolase III